MRIVLLTLLFIVTMGHTAEPAPRGVFQEPYNPDAPAFAVTYTEEQKQSQRETGKALFKQFVDAARSGQKEFKAPKGVYRIEGRGVRLEKIEGFTADWNGSELILEYPPNANKRSFIDFLYCKNVTVKNLVVDADPPAMPVAELLSFDAKQKTMDVQLLPGYANLQTPGRVMLFSRDGAWLRAPMFERTAVEPLGENRYRLTVNNNRVFTPPGGEPIPLQKGVLLSLDNDGSALFAMQFSSGLCLEDITTYSGKSFLWERDETGPNTFRRLKSLRRPGTSRLMGGGMCQVSYQNGGPTFEDCDFDAGVDDTINTLSTYAMLYERTAEKEFIIGPRWKAFDKGTTLRFYDYESMKLLGEGTITDLSEVKDKAISEASRKMAKEKPMSGLGLDPWKVTLDRDVQAGKYAWVMSSDHRPTGVVIRNCRFKNVETRPILINGCADVLIENNVIENAGGPAIQISFEEWFMEGPFPERVAIRNNYISNSGCSYHFDESWKVLFGGIFVGGDMRRQTQERLLKNITIENNRIENTMYAGITLYSAQDVLVKGNTIVNPVARKPLILEDGKQPGEKFYGVLPGGGIFVTSSSNIKIEKNTIITGPFSGEAVNIGRYTEQIESKDNQISSTVPKP